MEITAKNQRGDIITKRLISLIESRGALPTIGGEISLTIVSSVANGIKTSEKR
jgi:hypothetical protein